MAGTLHVTDIYHEPAGSFFVGEVRSGVLRPGMEARTDASNIVIRQLVSADAEAHIMDQARRGKGVVVQADAISPAEATALIDAVLEFSEIRSVPLRKGLVFRPDVG